MDVWRFLEIDWLTYAETAIYRPVLIRAVSEGIVPDTISFFRFKRPSIALNYFNDPEKEINLALCKEKNIPVFRVLSGGGPAFGDTGYVITFMDIARKNSKLPPDPPRMMEMVLTRMAAGISERFDVECRFKPLNDIEIRCHDGVWRKVGPSSCIYEEKAVKMASAIQVKEPDVDLIASLIVAHPEKFADKQVDSIQERITCLEKIVGRTINFDEIRDAYKSEIEELFEVEIVRGEFSDTERTYYNEMRSLFTSYEYFMERSEKKFGPIPSDVVRKTVQFKISEGPFIRIISFTRGDTIWEVLISGTIHASPLRPTSPIHEIEKSLRGQPIDQKLFESKIAEVLSRPNFTLTKVRPEFLAKKIYECAIQ
nr:lipoate--protein ligase family protein [Desulfobacterales bacterium]